MSGPPRAPHDGFTFGGRSLQQTKKWRWNLLFGPVMVASRAWSSPLRPRPVDGDVDHLLVLARIGPAGAALVGERVDRIEVGEVAARLDARRREHRHARVPILVLVAVHVA